MPMPATRWFDNSNEVIRFGHALIDADVLDTPKDVLYYFEKPWKWEPEHEKWMGLRTPTDDEADSDQWEKFLAALDQLHNQS